MFTMKKFNVERLKFGVLISRCSNDRRSRCYRLRWGRWGGWGRQYINLSPIYTDESYRKWLPHLPHLSRSQRLRRSFEQREIRTLNF